MKLSFGLILACIVISFFSCATSMTPLQFNSTLPSLTQYRLLSQLEADQLIEADQCNYLVRNRIYVAPMGLTTKDDLRYGARGIDEWIRLNGGDAFVLKNYKWVTVDGGGTQLHVEFDTIKCN